MKRILERVKLTQWLGLRHWYHFFTRWSKQRPLLQFCSPVKANCIHPATTSCHKFIFTLVLFSLHGTKFGTLVQITFSHKAGAVVAVSLLVVVRGPAPLWWLVAPALLRVGWALVPAGDDGTRGEEEGPPALWVGPPRHFLQAPAGVRDHFSSAHKDCLTHIILIRLATVPEYHWTHVSVPAL